MWNKKIFILLRLGFLTLPARLLARHRGAMPLHYGGDALHRRSRQCANLLFTFLRPENVRNDFKSRIATAALLCLISLSSHAAEVQEVALTGDSKAWLIEDQQLPVFSLAMRFVGCGGVTDPEGLEGRAEFTAALLDQGAGKLDAKAFQQALDNRAIKLGFDADKDDMTVQLKTTRAQMQEAFNLMVMALAQPRFDNEAIVRVRRQMQAALARQQQRASYHAGRRWSETAFAGHVYARPNSGTEASLKTLQKKDIQAQHTACLQRDRLIIAVAGAISPEELRDGLNPLLEQLPESTNDQQKIPVSFVQVSETPIVVDHAGPQTRVIFGMQGIPRDDPDFYAAYLLNHVIGGGGMASRLWQKIRRERGLVYGVSSWLNPQAHAAVWGGSMASRNESVAEAIAVLEEELRDVGQYGIRKEELEQARNYVTGSFALNLDTNSKLVGYLLLMQQENLGMDYLEKRNRYMQEVTHEQVQRVAKRLFGKLHLHVVMAGKPKLVAPDMSEEKGK